MGTFPAPASAPLSRKEQPHRLTHHILFLWKVHHDQLPSVLLGMLQEMPQESSGPGATAGRSQHQPGAPATTAQGMQQLREQVPGDTPCPWHMPGWHSPCHRAVRAVGSVLGHMRTHIPRSTNIPSEAMTVAAIWQCQAVPKSCCPHPKGTCCTPGEPPTVSPTSLGLWGLSLGHLHPILSSHPLPSPPPVPGRKQHLLLLETAGGFAFFIFLF